MNCRNRMYKREEIGNRQVLKRLRPVLSLTKDKTKYDGKLIEGKEGNERKKERKVETI